MEVLIQIGAFVALIAVGLGADVPFFLTCRPSRATGIGDVLEPIPRAPKGTLLIAVSPDRVNTAWAYRSALGRLTSGRAAPRVRPFPRSIDAVEAWFFNDFQRGVEGAFGSVRRARESLDGLGALGDDAHAPGEYANIDALYLQIRRAALLFYRLTR